MRGERTIEKIEKCEEKSETGSRDHRVLAGDKKRTRYRELNRRVGKTQKTMEDIGGRSGDSARRFGERRRT